MVPSIVENSLYYLLKNFWRRLFKLKELCVYENFSFSFIKVSEPPGEIDTKLPPNKLSEVIIISESLGNFI